MEENSKATGPNAKRAIHESKGTNRGSITYSTDQENGVSKIFILCLTGSGTISIHPDAPRKQNESI